MSLRSLTERSAAVAEALALGDSGGSYVEACLLISERSAASHHSCGPERATIVGDSSRLELRIEIDARLAQPEKLALA
jgi:hypothetical protein